MRDSIDVLAVNVASPQVLAEHDDVRVYSAIAKEPVAFGTTRWLSAGNLAGDAQADLSVHGGPDEAVYAYPSEHLPDWAADIGELTGPAAFGENLSTRGVVESDVAIGDVWRWNQALVQVCQPRWPCFKLALHRQQPDILSRMRATGPTGWYLRVLEPGEVTVGAPMQVVDRDPARLTVADAHLAMADRALRHRELVEALATHATLAEAWRDPLRERLARA